MTEASVEPFRLVKEEAETLLPLQGFSIPDIQIDLQGISSFKELFHLKALTRQIRVPIVRNIFAARVVNLRSVESLRNARRSLEMVYFKDHESSMIRIDGSRSVQVDLSYEIGELKKDTYYLEHGEDEFLEYLSRYYSDFEEYLGQGLNFLRNRQFNCFITDRDGTTNNYCGHYRSSIQPVYNAVLLSRFALQCTQNPVFITSAPLRDFGIIDVSVNPDNVFIYAGSKGREFIDLDGNDHRAPVEAAKEEVLEELFRKVAELEAVPDFEKFFYIGSGMQRKFGQLTLARQDVMNSIPEEESLKLLGVIEQLVRELDPEGDVLRIHDTGRDIEVIATIGSGTTIRDFDKGDGLKYIDSCGQLDLRQGPHLVCGDTSSDIPMLEAVLEYSDEVQAIFVTRDPHLMQRVRAICPDSLFVPSPDILLTILGLTAIYPDGRRKKRVPLLPAS
ncbi:trehalose 6-phosphate synthase [Prosthecochloris vibrioformis]|uniref:Trehalose 6-phosphate synthase n=1 Tax=Prosthecochloris vibrioformis TaxID=1098 RepID=A0A5C4RZP5_PROVB|nr:trehalose 6-phosphate synthase [Prosthecochloris vibrioformis]TNJ36465.1 trehalose 6-phosphate synthase [Prosthecochloris vibrioformis]